MNRCKYLSLILFIALLAGIVVACNKEDDFVLQGTYSLPAHINVEAVRMFTVAGEVKDKTVIDNFLNTPKGPFGDGGAVYDLSTGFYLDSPTLTIDGDAYCNITFKQSLDMAIINAKFMDLSTFGVAYDADIVRLDPLVIVSANTGSLYMEKPSKTTDYFYIDQVLKIKSLLGIPSPLDPIDGFGGKSQMRSNFPFIIVNNEVSVPVLIFSRLYNDFPRYISLEWKKSWNIANEDYLRNLSLHDTILIQEGKAVLRKQ